MNETAKKEAEAIGALLALIESGTITTDYLNHDRLRKGLVLVMLAKIPVDSPQYELATMVLALLSE